MIFLILFLLTVQCEPAPGHYECGVHGRFEYCIDDFPGCVIGCHCYPGYYFDTDSKICEPNTKLTQDYRRHMIPTGYNLHGSNGAFIPPVVSAAPPPLETTASPDDPGQDSNNGDLSDWLYNQFFKTIESQVVNKTDDEPVKMETRRSGAPIEPFLARRHSSRRKKSRKRKKKDDDESDKDSSSDSSSESDSGDSKGDLGSWERFEFGPRPSQNAPPQATKDGSHRQIVMYSKKPKPPLPSFIFLPNMGTMFYPPIGLPAPPIPMYPMVPIPPINPGQGDPPAHVENDKTTISTSSHEPTTSVSTTTTTTTTTSSTTHSTTTTSSTPPTKSNLRNHNFYNQFLPKKRIKPQPRHVFKPSPLPPPVENPVKQYHQDSDYDAMFMGDNNFLLDQGGPDFKYISDLIHRQNNESTSQPPMINYPKRNDKLIGIKPPILHENKKRQPITPGRLDSTRRRFDPIKNGEDDSYYSSLGKQIAKLIRGLDSADVLGADIKIEPAEFPKPAHPFFSESSYAARTYWERFVRSPLSLRLKNFTKYEDLIASNENLFELENQVQEATSAPALSWLQLENLISTMGAIRNQEHDRTLKNNNDKSSNASLNVSLLPQFIATRSLMPYKPETRANDDSLFASFHDVIGKFTKSDRKQKIASKEFKNKTKKLHDHLNITRNKSLVNNQPRSIYLSTNIHKPHRIVSTLKPIFFTTHKKGKNHDKRRRKVDHDSSDIDYFNEIENKPRMVSIDGKTTFVKTKKYFFDSITNYQIGNWVID